jgi:hypothetical protein
MVGAYSLLYGAPGSNNTAVGTMSLSSLTNSNNGGSPGGNDNTAVGTNAIRQGGAANGNRNTAVGSAALSNGSAPSDNTAIGYNTLSVVSGDANTAVGSGALLANTIGSNNTAIGYNANVGSGTLSNATAIGNGATVTTSNTIQLGNTSVTNVKTSGTLTAGIVTYPNTDGTSGQVLSTTGSGTLTWTTVSGSGVSSIGSISGTSDIKGATISGTTLTLTPANASNGGIVTAGVQTFSGAKTFSSTVSINTLGVGINSPAASAVLEASSTTKGFLPPRMTGNQRDAITNPATGLIIYCTNCGLNGGEPEYYNGRIWVNLVGGTTQSAVPNYSPGADAYGGKSCLSIYLFRSWFRPKC